MAWEAQARCRPWTPLLSTNVGARIPAPEKAEMILWAAFCSQLIPFFCSLVYPTKTALGALEYFQGPFVVLIFLSGVCLQVSVLEWRGTRVLLIVWLQTPLSSAALVATRLSGWVLLSTVTLPSQLLKLHTASGLLASFPFDLGLNRPDIEPPSLPLKMRAWGRLELKSVREDAFF